jgi:hypothetical protein
MFMKNKRAASILEYSIMLGLIVLVFYVMNTYIKRSMQANVKDGTDYFLGGGNVMQDEEVYPRSVSTSNVSSNSSSNIVSKDMIGGSKVYAGDEYQRSDSRYKTVDTKSLVDAEPAGSTSTVNSSTVGTYTPVGTQ